MHKNEGTLEDVEFYIEHFDFNYFPFDDTAWHSEQYFAFKNKIEDDLMAYKSYIRKYFILDEYSIGQKKVKEFTT